MSNGANGSCAPASAQIPVDLAHFGLGEPEDGTHWVRGFTAFHNGVDISTGVAGSLVLAAQAGQVIFAGWDPYGFGWAVKINHCGGLATAYGHLQRVLVSAGQTVTPGQPIGLQGSSGLASGTHLHFMTWWNNIPVDPLCAYAHLAGISGNPHASWCPPPR
jgi:murein DD-endopeptidase MepM/ murein hydrolase activator NlpD